MGDKAARPPSTSAAELSAPIWNSSGLSYAVDGRDGCLFLEVDTGHHAYLFERSVLLISPPFRRPWGTYMLPWSKSTRAF